MDSASEQQQWPSAMDCFCMIAQALNLMVDTKTQKMAHHIQSWNTRVFSSFQHFTISQFPCEIALILAPAHTWQTNRYYHTNTNTPSVASLSETSAAPTPSMRRDHWRTTTDQVVVTNLQRVPVQLVFPINWPISAGTINWQLLVPVSKHVFTKPTHVHFKNI